MGKLFLDLTGIGFLLQMRRTLGNAGFLLAFTGVLLLMFLAGAKIENYGHLGEAQYVMTILPLASCFSPILAVLMTLAFAIGDCLTNAAFWLFPGLYKMFGKSDPLLTWGAYARMDFITLPIYALLPGIGSRTLYTVASQLFQAGRARVMRDGGSGSEAQLKAQLNQALQQQGVCAAKEQAAGEKFAESEARAAEASEKVREADAQQAEVKEASERFNAETKAANADAAKARTGLQRANERVEELDAEAARLGGQKDKLEAQQSDVDARLRLASEDQRDLEEKREALGREKGDAQEAVSECRGRVEELASRRAELLEMGKTGLGPDGRPLSPQELAQVRQEYLKTQAEYSSENERLAEALAKQKKLDEDLAGAEKQLEAKKAEADELLEKYHQTQRQLDEAAKASEAAEARAKLAREEAARQESALEDAQERAASSQKQAQMAKERLGELARERAQAAQAMNQAVAQRNALLQQAKAAEQQRMAADQRVAELEQALAAAGKPPSKQPPKAPPKPGKPPVAEKPKVPPVVPPVVPAVAEGPAEGGGHRRRPKDDFYKKFLQDWDRQMYENMEKQRREREALIRDMQDRYKGELPSGVAGYDVAGVGDMAGAGIASVGAAAVGAAAGAALGGTLLHGHMWAEYMKFRSTPDPGCYHMDSRFLDKGILSGAATGAAGSPVAVVTADAGGVGPGGIPGSGTGPAGSGPTDAPGSYVSGGPGGPGGAPPFGSDEEKDAWEASKKAKQEAEDMKKQWEESEKTADKSDPNYEKNKKQYEDYIAAKEKEAADAEGKYNEMKDAAAKKAADEAEAKAYKDQWIKSRQDDLKAAEEEKAHLAAVMKGADGAGFDTAEHKRRMDELNDRIGQLHGQLGKEGADISYTAADRGTIAPGKEFMDGIEKAAQLKQQAEQIAALNAIQQAALGQNLWNPGGPGDVVGKVQDIKDKLLQGKGVDPSQLANVIRIINDHATGKADYGKEPPPMDGVGKSIWDAGWETAKNMGHCTTSDGKFCWTAAGLRTILGFCTGGTSEAIFIPAAGAVSAKETLDKGGSKTDAVLSAGWEMGKQVLIGKAIGAVVKTGAGGVTGGAAGMKAAGKEVIKDASSYFSPKAWANSWGKTFPQGVTQGIQSGVEKGVEKGLNAIDRIGNILKGKEGYTGTGFDSLFGGAGAGGAKGPGEPGAPPKTAAKGPTEPAAPPKAAAKPAAPPQPPKPPAQPPQPKPPEPAPPPPKPTEPAAPQEPAPPPKPPEKAPPAPEPPKPPAEPAPPQTPPKPKGPPGPKDDPFGLKKAFKEGKGSSKDIHEKGGDKSGSLGQDGAGSTSAENISRGEQYDFYKMKDGKLEKVVYEPGLEDDPLAIGIPKGEVAENIIQNQGKVTHAQVIGKGYNANDPSLKAQVGIVLDGINKPSGG